MIVLSLFGGAEQGFATLKEMKITPTRYFSSEVDPYAIKLAKANFPDIEHIGSVLDVTVNNTAVMGDKTYHCGAIDFLIGGPPCQDLSIAGKRAGLDGEKSSLFWEYVRILKETKPKAFFMENVASMPKEAKATITEALFGIEPMYIDSRLTSCQTRKRLYWLGIRQPDGTYKGIDIPQPEDVGILMKDILEDIPADSKLWLSEKEIAYMNNPTYAKRRWTMTTKESDGKIGTVTANMCRGVPYNVLIMNDGRMRKFSVSELARAQSFPEWYSFDSISASRAYKAIGNSWEGGAIKHIWKFIWKR